MQKSLSFVVAFAVANCSATALAQSSTGQAQAQCSSVALLPGWPSDAPVATNGRLEPNLPRRVTLPQGSAATYDGSVSIAISQSGVYEVSLGSAAWVDMAQGDDVLASIGHRHGPPCSGIRKIVEFALQPGRYELRLSRSAQPLVQVMISQSR